MTAEDYRSAGYALSSHIEQTAINRAETDVKQAYVFPIMPNASVENDTVKAAVMALASLRLLQSSTFATRAGAKTKQTAQSYTTEQAVVLAEMARTCDMKLRALRATAGANSSAKVDDICSIYFETNYLYN